MNRFCNRCGAQIPDGINFCGNCGTPAPSQIPGQQMPPVQPYYAYPQSVRIPGSDKKIVAGVLALLLGGLGAHKFYLGYIGAGIIQIVLTIVTCGAFVIVGHIEGILYLIKSDEEFVDTYVNGRREWF
jgi:TM2 domain-containing membrane protein YozV